MEIWKKIWVGVFFWTQCTMCFAMLLSVFWRYSSRWHRNCGLGPGVLSLHAVSRDGHHHGTKNLMPSHRFVYSGECYCEMFFLHTCSVFLIPADTRLSAWRFYMSPTLSPSWRKSSTTHIKGVTLYASLTECLRNEVTGVGLSRRSSEEQTTKTGGPRTLCQ